MEKLIFALGIIEIIICVVCFFFKKKYQMLICLLTYNIILVVQYLLQQYITETIIVIIDIIRTIIFFIFAYKNLKPNIFIIILFEIATITCCVITWSNWFSLFVLFASMISTFSYWQKNVFLIRIFALISSTLLMLNYFYTGLYTTIIAEAITFISCSISLFVYRKELFNKKDNAIEQSTNS